MKKGAAVLIACLAVSVTLCSRTVKSGDVTDNNTVIPDKSIIVPDKSTDPDSTGDLPSHSGLYDIKVSGYKGEIFIGIADGKLYGTIKFFNWGNGVPQPLLNLRINDDKIYFRRVINTREDLIKYGGTAYFEQDFYGIFSQDKKIIKGYYKYFGTQDNWEAIKK